MSRPAGDACAVLVDGYLVESIDPALDRGLCAGVSCEEGVALGLIFVFDLGFVFDFSFVYGLRNDGDGLVGLVG